MKKYTAKERVSRVQLLANKCIEDLELAEFASKHVDPGMGEGLKKMAAECADTAYWLVMSAPPRKHPPKKHQSPSGSDYSANSWQ